MNITGKSPESGHLGDSNMGGDFGAELVKDGISRKDDTLPQRYFNEPIPEGPARGEVILEKEFNEMLDEYYRLHHWDKKGVPQRKTIRSLGLDESS